jgi:hypothetical protein
VVAGDVVEHANAWTPPVRAELHHSSAMANALMQWN